MGKMWNTDGFVRNTQGKRLLGRIGMVGRLILKWLF
jgi:hypothetical protein